MTDIPPHQGVSVHVLFEGEMNCGREPFPSMPSPGVTEQIISAAAAKTARSCFHPPLPRHLVVGVVVAADAEAKELAGSTLDLEPLDLQGALQQPVAGLQVPVAAPQEVHAADGQEVSGGQPLQEGLELICRVKGREEAGLRHSLH